MEKENENLKKIIINLLNYIEDCRKNGILPSEIFCKSVEERIEAAIGQQLPECRYETIKITTADDFLAEEFACRRLAHFLFENKLFKKEKENNEIMGKICHFSLDVRVPKKRRI